MRKILVPVDGHSQTELTAALAEAARISALEPVEVHLLSVQPALSGHVRMFFAASELHEIQQEAGAAALAPAQALLERNHVAYTSSVRVGRHAETIASAARELGCDRIVLAQEDRPGLAGKVFGSLAQQVRHLVSVRGGCHVIGA